jgi:hypothetical protein
MQIAPLKLAAKHRTKTVAHVELKTKPVALFGVAFSEKGVHKFVQAQLLVGCFYVSVFLCTYLHMYIKGKAGYWMAPNTWCILSLGSLLFNIAFVMPINMFLGFRYCLVTAVCCLVAAL